MSDRHLSIFFLILYSSIQFFPSFGAFDKDGPQFFILSLCCLFSSLYILLWKRESLLPLHNITLVKSLFTIASGLSIIIAFNKIESLILLFQIIIYLLSIVNLYYHINYIKLSEIQFSWVLSVLLLSEVLLVLVNYIFLYGFDAPNARTNQLAGLSGNINIFAFSSLFRLFFLEYIFIKSRNIYVKSSIFFALVASIFAILVSSSRGAILGLIITHSILIFYLISTRKKNYIKSAIFVFSIIVSVFLIQKNLYENNSLSIGKRLSTLSSKNFLNDTSNKERLAWYKSAIEGINDKPLTGFGLGNWKILANKYANDALRGYTVPVHAHNDFLEVFVELGVIGFLLFILLFISIFYTLYRYRKEFGTFIIFLFLAIVTYILDSLLNFPIHRPVAFTNLILVIAFIISKSNNTTAKSTIYSTTFLLFLCLCTVLSSYKIFVFRVQEVNFRNKVNNRTEFKLSVDELNEISHAYPTLNHSTIPVLIFKALYHWKDKEIDKAKALLFKANNYNPYLFISEANLGRIYLEENKIDSAYIYAKKAFYGMKKNERHASIYQAVIGVLKDKYELEKIYEITKDLKSEPLYTNHLKLVLAMNEGGKYSKSDSLIAREALKLFPFNNDIKKTSVNIIYGNTSVNEFNEISLRAQNSFNLGNYVEASENWEEAKNILPEEPSTYLNLAQVYTILDKLSLAESNLNEIFKLNLTIQEKGKDDFLKSMIFLKKNEFKNACLSLNKANLKGYDKNKLLKIARSLNCVKIN